METQTLVTFGARNYRLGTREVRQTVVHELAHAWYGDTVTPDDWSDLWMNEGMAMYVEALFSTSQGWQTWAYWDDQFTSTDGALAPALRPARRLRPRPVRADQRLLLHRADAGPAPASGSAPASSTTWSAAGRRSTATPCRTGRRTSPGWPRAPARTRSRCGRSWTTGCCSPTAAGLMLSDLVVVDLTRALAGPHAAMMLADLGARVIKVESPAGDDSRTWGPPFVGPGGRPGVDVLPLGEPQQGVGHRRPEDRGGPGVPDPAGGPRRRADGELPHRRAGPARLLDASGCTRSTRGWSSSRSPASATTGPRAAARATTRSPRARPG